MPVGAAPLWYCAFTVTDGMAMLNSGRLPLVLAPTDGLNAPAGAGAVAPVVTTACTAEK